MAGMATDPNSTYPKPAVAWMAVAVLMLAYTFSFIDRLILSLLVEPIKQDLGLSDVQISLLQGFSFALFYTLAGIPVGRLVDSRGRTTIVAIGVALWSTMTAVTALAQQYWQLFLARAGVGVGEATLVPAAYSMISDLFAPDRRGLALGIFSSGTSVGAGLALIIGGYAISLISDAGERTLPLVGALEPWRLAFIYVGLPGLLVALLIKAVPEPARRFSAWASDSDARKAIPLNEIVAHYRRHARAVVLHHAGMSLSAMAAYGIMSWAPAMLMRTQGWNAADVGLSVGSSILIAGTAGVIGGGWLGDAWARRGRGAGRINAAFVSMIIAATGAALYPLQESAVAIVAAFMLAMLGAFMVIGCGAAALLDIMPNRLRGQATAVYFFVISLAGIGLGPTAVAVCTDYVFGDPAAVRYSLLIVPTAGFAVAAACFLAARRPFARSLGLVQARGIKGNQEIRPVRPSRRPCR